MRSHASGRVGGRPAGRPRRWRRAGPGGRPAGGTAGRSSASRRCVRPAAGSASRSASPDRPSARSTVAGTVAGDLDGAVEAAEALGQVGPHERPQRAAGPRRSSRRSASGRSPAARRPRPGPEVGQARRSTGRSNRTGEAGSPKATVPGLVAVAVPPQVEPGARADLQQPQRPPEPGDLEQPPASAADRPTSLVCTPSSMRRASSSTCSATVASKSRLDVGPGRAAGRRVVRGELRRPALEHDAVHRAEEAQRRAPSRTGRARGGAEQVADRAGVADPAMQWPRMRS